MSIINESTSIGLCNGHIIDLRQTYFCSKCQCLVQFHNSRLRRAAKTRCVRSKQLFTLTAITKANRLYKRRAANIGCFFCCSRRKHNDHLSMLFRSAVTKNQFNRFSQSIIIKIILLCGRSSRDIYWFYEFRNNSKSVSRLVVKLNRSALLNERSRVSHSMKCGCRQN